MTLDEKVDDTRIVLRAAHAPGDHYRALFERSPIAQLIATPDGRLLQLNSAFAQLVGAEESELRGRLIAELIVREDRAAFGTLTRRVLARGGDAVAAQLRFVDRAGSTLQLRVTSALLRNSDGSGCIMHTLEDLTERQRSEDEVQQLHTELDTLRAALDTCAAEVESFSYSVSHDLRAPLRSIEGFSRLLGERHGPLFDEAGVDYLQRIQSASQRMNALIDHLLELARVTRSELARQACDLSALARAISAELHATDLERVVRWQIADDMIVHADPRLLRIALVNLLGNAWKYSARSPRANIELGSSERDGARVYFVRDDGVGFDMACAARLFGAFQRLHSASEFDGNGIGLALVQRVVRLHGGRVWAEGALDKGATFYFTLEPPQRTRVPSSRLPTPPSTAANR